MNMRAAVPQPEEPVLRGSQALARLMLTADVRFVLDVGSGAGLHAERMRAGKIEVFTCDLQPGADFCGNFMDMKPRGDFDAVWACHVLEHQPNPNLFLRQCLAHLRPGGLLAVTVPPLKHEIVGGHVSLWNAGLLCYQLILAGFDCREARIGTYASGPGFPVYNISALVRRPETPLELPPLRMDSGDVDTLAHLFPCKAFQGFDGRLPDIRW